MQIFLKDDNVQKTEGFIMPFKDHIICFLYKKQMPFKDHIFGKMHIIAHYFSFSKNSVQQCNRFFLYKKVQSVIFILKEKYA